MSYKDIMKAHETRMWLKDVIIPAVTVCAVIFANNPELKDKAKNTVSDILAKFRK